MKLLRSTKFWIAALLILLAASAVAAYAVSKASVKGATANIYMDGELIKTIVLADAREQGSFEIRAQDGGYNIITVENGRICVTEADCPDQICVKQGWIADGVKPIVCLPHRVIIRITGTPSKFDAAS